MQNPKLVIDNVLDPKPITLGQFALLERIQSPFLGEAKPYAFYELLPSLYILSMTPAEASQHLGNLEADALQWADTLTSEEAQTRIQNANDAIEAFIKAIPKKGDNTQKKA
jgi:hypothetical protein